MACMPGPDSPVDTASGHSVSFAPPHLSRPSRRADPATAGRHGASGRRTGPFSHGALGDGMNGYPIQPAKVQRPPLRDETLARDRLLDWLAAKIHQRVILVLADAGYGKTTLLADFSRRTRLRTLWYRLDEDDRDWISFLSHLVAAGREHDPAFAPTTARCSSDLAMGGPTREAATDVFLRELPSIAEHGAVLILDDFHLVDESPDVRLIVRELVARAPERLSIVFASRRTPTRPARPAARIGRGRRDRHRRPALRRHARPRGCSPRRTDATLEPDVLADVAARTEGWAASLQLVQAALRDRSPAEIRRFVRGLTRRRSGALRLPRRRGRRRARPPRGRARMSRGTAGRSRWRRSAGRPSRSPRPRRCAQPGQRHGRRPSAGEHDRQALGRVRHELAHDDPDVGRLVDEVEVVEDQDGAVRP